MTDDQALKEIYRQMLNLQAAGVRPVTRRERNIVSKRARIWAARYARALARCKHIELAIECVRAHTGETAVPHPESPRHATNTLREVLREMKLRADHARRRMEEMRAELARVDLGYELHRLGLHAAHMERAALALTEDTP